MAEPVLAYDINALAAWDEHSLPSSDGKPMAENTRHARILVHSVNVVGAHYAHRDDVLVAADLLLYYPKESNQRHHPSGDEPTPYGSVAPDLFVAFGVSSRDRKSYVLWQEGRVPSFALEVVSESSTERDREDKKSIYERLGVTEYIVFDPDQKLEGFRLRDGRYRPMPWTAIGLGRDGLYSGMLGLFLFPFGPENELEWYDPATSEILRNYRQAEQGRLEAEGKAARAQAEAVQARARANRLEARNAELLARLRKQQDDASE